ncbi:transposase [Streptomyces sp. NBC_01283]|uniref:transposase n=1 Tax=Streptomyces sp. NBC_01283 TaxID=2903812 RepID=UPI00352EDEB9
MARRQLAYPTDLSDAEWEALAPLVPPPKRSGRPPKHPRREISDAFAYWLRAGCAGRLLPHDFPPYQTVYHYWRQWRIEGRWEEILGALPRRRLVVPGSTVLLMCGSVPVCDGRLAPEMLCPWGEMGAEPELPGVRPKTSSIRREVDRPRGVCRWPNKIWRGALGCLSWSALVVSRRGSWRR